MGEVISLEQQGLAEISCERVRETVAKVKARHVAAPLPEESVGLAGDLSMPLGQGFDIDMPSAEEVVEPTAEHWIAVPVNHDCGFEIGPGRHKDFGAPTYSPDVTIGVGLAAEDGDDRRGVDDHLGSPASS